MEKNTKKKYIKITKITRKAAAALRKFWKYYYLNIYIFKQPKGLL